MSGWWFTKTEQNWELDFLVEMQQESIWDLASPPPL